jgi:hypothetical protein
MEREEMVQQNHTFDILREIGKIPLSSTQEYRILLVRDEDLGIRISAQKWWRPNREEEWKAGKGFLLTGRQASEMGRMLTECGNQILNVKN